MAEYDNLVARFSEACVLVVGDVYLDENLFGIMTGISLEAPIPIYEVHDRRRNPGAAGNTACNAAALGAATSIVGVVGVDVNADILRSEFAARNVDASGLVVDATKPTNTYGKLKAGGHNILVQEVLRTDTPTPPFVSGDVEDQVIAAIEARASAVDAVVVVDQIASVATDRVLAAVVRCAREHHALTVGDSRSRIGAFKGFDLVVPNDREAGTGVGINIVDRESLDCAGKALIQMAKTALITRGAEGITVYDEDGSITDVPIKPCKVVDVTGAGDTVTAAATLTLVAGGSPQDAARIGNAAASVAISKPGVVTVSSSELEAALSGAAGIDKIKTLDELKTILHHLQQQGKSVVWTNGCFDILHAGHITYLMKARQAGDILVVGLNSDQSIREIKGPSRPIVPETERALILSAFECVDYVTLFSDPDTTGMLRALRPNVYAKGGDYTVDTINQEERRIIESYGGRIHIVPGVEGRSTTNIIAKIINNNKHTP